MFGEMGAVTDTVTNAGIDIAALIGSAPRVRRQARDGNRVERPLPCNGRAMSREAPRSA
jgi:hypothetical protein